mmetsp:Transcript_13322/g.24509  ORF Transcript_13322/g.24509 Transcript_13322/m.24509 type:complete len:89 (+) Transcript_13322:832-1098(+)
MPCKKILRTEWLRIIEILLLISIATHIIGRRIIYHTPDRTMTGRLLPNRVMLIGRGDFRIGPSLVPPGVEEDDGGRLLQQQQRPTRVV